MFQTRAQAEAEEVLADAKAANSRRVSAFCEAQAAELLAAVGVQVIRLNVKTRMCRAAELN